MQQPQNTSLDAQREYLAFLSSGKTPAMTEQASAQDKKSHATLKALRAKPLNNVCFDCEAMMPGWAALPHGVFICIDCAQVHRHLGRHISQVKSVNTGTYLWYPKELQLMEQVGNAKATRAFSGCNLPPKPPRDATGDQRLAYCQLKYDKMRTKPVWVEDDTVTAVEPAKASVPPPAPPPVAMTPLRPKPVAKKPAGMQGATRTVLAPVVAAPQVVAAAAPPVVKAAPSVDLIDFDAVAVQPAPAAPSQDAFFAQFGL